MIPGLLDVAPLRLTTTGSEPQVLIVVTHPAARYTIARKLQDAGFSVTTSGAYGVVELLEEADFDLLVTAQSFEEMAHFGVPQLARSMQPYLPIVVLEVDAAVGEGVLDAVEDAIERWPLRARAARQLH